MRAIAEKVKDAEQDRVLGMEADKIATTKKLEAIEAEKLANKDDGPKFFLNKRDKKRMSKIRADSNLSEAEKNAQINEI